MAMRLFSPMPRLAPVAFALPSIPIAITVPPLLADLWESVLRAVPKKKTSHMKKRHRQMAGKALKDVQSLNKCPGCGQIKRAHLLCPHCVRGMWMRCPESVLVLGIATIRNMELSDSRFQLRLDMTLHSLIEEEKLTMSRNQGFVEDSADSMRSRSS